MTSKFWVKGCKFSAVVGTTLGLLIPGLPPLAAAPSVTLGENSSFAPAEKLLIAQQDDGCSSDNNRVDHFITDSYSISICVDDSGIYYYVGLNLSNGVVTNISDITRNDDGSYVAISYDNEGSEIKYTVGDYLRVTNNGDQVVYQEVLAADSTRDDQSEKIMLIGQSGCSGNRDLVEQLLTANHHISICKDAYNGMPLHYFEIVNISTEFTNRIEDVIINDDGSYEGTNYDNDGNEMKYTVGDGYLRVTNNGDQVVYEEIY